MNDSWIDKQMLNITNSWNYLTGDNNKFIPVDTSIKTDYVYDVTPSFVKSFREAEARMEKEAREKELREKQIKNKRLRDMVKKVIINKPCTIIMWNDGTKTVTQCHELDSYDPEKGILACMAKKLYENTNLFNEIVQEYVDFNTYNIEPKENERLEQAKKAIDKLQTTLDAVTSTAHDLEKELTYYKRLAEKLANDVETRDDCLSTKVRRIKGLEDELAYRKADTQICEDIIVELQEKINNLEAQKETLQHRLEDADNRIEALEDEVCWNEREIDDLREELYEAQTDHSE